MKILIEVRKGIVTKCYSTNKDEEVIVLDFDSQEEVPTIQDCESEYMTAKQMREYVEEQMKKEDLTLESYGD